MRMCEAERLVGRGAALTSGSIAQQLLEDNDFRRHLSKTTSRPPFQRSEGSTRCSARVAPINGRCSAACTRDTPLIEIGRRVARPVAAAPPRKEPVSPKPYRPPPRSPWLARGWASRALEWHGCVRGPIPSPPPRAPTSARPPLGFAPSRAMPCPDGHHQTFPHPPLRLSSRHGPDLSTTGAGPPIKPTAVWTSGSLGLPPSLCAAPALPLLSLLSSLFSPRSSMPPMPSAPGSSGRHAVRMRIGTPRIYWDLQVSVRDPTATSTATTATTTAATNSAITTTTTAGATAAATATTVTTLRPRASPPCHSSFTRRMTSVYSPLNPMAS